MSRAVCRVCLAGTGDVRLLTMDDRLLELYDKLTSSKLSSGDGKYNRLCYICYSQLQKCQRFSDMARRSERYLRDVLESNTKVHEEMASVQNFTRIQTLSVLKLKPISFDGVSKGRNKPTNKKEPLKNEPTTKGYMENDTAKEGLIKKEIIIKGFNIKKDIIKDIFNKETIEEGLINKKEIASQEFIKKEELALEEMTNEENVNDFDEMTDVKEYLIINDTELYYECDACDDVFPIQEDLIAHKKIHKIRTEQKLNIGHITGSLVPKKETYCPICKKIFSGSSSSLVEHMQIHTGERPFTCSICGHSSRTRQHLTEHIRIHTGERVHCKVCNASFSQKSSLSKHMFIHTGEEPHCCHICGKSFKQSGQMRSHIRIIHEGVRSHRCDVCSKRFAGKSHWQRHMATHSSEKAYSCEKCHTEFTTNATKTRHMKRHCKKQIKI